MLVDIIALCEVCNLLFFFYSYGERLRSRLFYFLVAKLEETVMGRRWKPRLSKGVDGEWRE
jgi:hypothetical protein